MIIDPDYLIERKYYKSQLKKWKILTLLLITAIVVLFIFRNRVGYSTSLATGDYIANIQIDDLIYDDIKLNNLLHQIKNDEKLKL
ncbi:periplasmic serine proteases domain protein [Orientia tsutsugamushi str. Sido]|nr:periplasmic serine proteases domain protein [Orientia tsutsugamushi str. Sido]